MTFLKTLSLQNFRCYSQASLEDLKPGFVILYGANGAGKTNLLEAVSYLSPGRGLRSAKVQEVQFQNTSNSWAISSTVETHYGEIKIGTGLDAEKNKRIIKINGETAKSQAQLGEYLSCLWLTPQMDRLFLDGASGRRKFLDRMIFAFDPAHAGRVTRYENAMSQRSKLLREHDHPDPSWLDGLEIQMAESGVAISAARMDFIKNLQTSCDTIEGTEFPVSKISLEGDFEKLFDQKTAIDLEKDFCKKLALSRTQDSVSGGAAFGPHKSDLHVVYAAKSMAADQCSTGEQKALLIGIVLAHARLVKAETGAPPLMLLDEVAAHLDENRRASLYHVLEDLGAQIWMTGTDRSLFQSLEGEGQFFKIQNAGIYPEKE